MLKFFSEALEDLIDEYVEGGEDMAEIRGALELKLMALNEEDE